MSHFIIRCGRKELINKVIFRSGIIHQGYIEASVNSLKWVSLTKLYHLAIIHYRKGEKAYNSPLFS